MLKKIGIAVFIFTFYAGIFAQGQAYYLPYEMPTHSAVKFNTFLMNPALPLLGLEEQNAGLYYRNQWMGYKDSGFSLMGLSYGLKWNELSSANAFVYKRQAGIMTNMGVVLNYGHTVEFSSGLLLHLGLNVIPSYTGVDQSRVILANPNEPNLSFKKSFALTAQPGVDFVFGDFHFGVTAENLVDYSLGEKKAMTPIDDKTFTGHLMYRSEIEANSDMFSGAHWSVMARASKEQSQIYLSGNALLDMPKLGWLYAGYTQKYGIFTGIGFNINDMISVGLEYENGMGGKIPQLQSTIGAYINVQFGGLRQQKSVLDRERQRKKRAEARKRAQERLKNQIAEIRKPKADTTPKPKPTPKPEPKPKPTVEAPANTAVNIRQESIANDKIPVGYYVVVGVYQDPRNAFRYIQSLRKKYDVAGFVHPANGRTYVYLGGASLSLEKAQELYKKNLFNEDFLTTGIWVLRVVKK